MDIFSGSDRINNSEEKCSSSYFRPTVSLRDWWLIKAENDFQGKRLAVAGFTSGEQRALRVFHSAPITKRFDICTLETADGVTVIFQSSINKIRTMENGFPSEVFHHFLLGFPPYWEEYAENCFEQAVNSGFDLQETSNFNKATADPGTKDVTPISSPSKHKDINHDKSKECSVQIVAEENDVTPAIVERGSSNAIRITSGSKIYSRVSGNLKDNQKKKPVSGRSMQQRNKEMISDVFEHPVGRKLKKSSHPILQEEEARPKEMLKTSRWLRNLSENSKTKEQNEQISVKKGGSSMKKARREIIFDRHASPLTGKSKEKTCIVSPETLSLKRSRSGRLLLPTLDFWRNQIPVYDADRNITGIQEELRLYGGSKSEPQRNPKKKQLT